MSRRFVSGNLVYNGNFEIAPPFTAPTTNSSIWIDGTAAGSSALSAYGWGNTSGALSATANSQFDSSVSHSGSNSLKLSTLDATGKIVVGSYAASSPAARDIFPLSPGTSYTLTAWIKTNNVAPNAVWVDIREFNGSLGTITTTSTPKLSGTNDWTQVSLTITTQASTVGGILFLRNNVAGNIGQAWFDDIVLTLTAATTRSLAS